MKELNGFVEEFYILGDLSGSYYINDNGEPIVTNPSQAKRFSNYSEASTYYKERNDNYNDYLYPQEVRVTVQLI